MGIRRDSGKVNIPDIVLGCLLMVGLPLGTLLAVRDAGRDARRSELEAGPAEERPKAVMGVEELDEVKQEYVRMYNENATLFLRRSRDPELAEPYRAQEVAWARSTLERLQKGFASLKKSAQASSGAPDFDVRVPELERWVKKVDADLRGLPAALPPASQAGPAPQQTAPPAHQEAQPPAAPAGAGSSPAPGR